MSEQVFGIDLGTTYSAIAYINDFGQAEVILNREGDFTTPSVVFFESETNFVVGKEAKNEVLLNRETTVSLIKRHMGTGLTLEFFGKPFRPETISAIILKDLVDYARDAKGIDSNKVVITVPAYFGIAEKEATRQAGVAAGLDVLGIVTEPVAAALSVGITGEQTRTIFVYDLGGGTFDCTIMELSPGKVDVVVTDGDRQLGGADWDTALFNLVVQKFVEQAGLGDEDPTEDEDFAQKLTTAVEECKKTLSLKETARLTLSFGDALEKIEVTRAEFEAATRSLVEDTLRIVRRTLESAQAKRPGLVLDEVLLVGGSSRMPMIEASLEKEMGWTLHKTEFDLAVAKGAAIYGQGTVAFDEVQGENPAPADGETPGEPSTAPKMLSIGGTAVEIHNVLSRSIGVKYVRENPAFPDGWEPYIGFHANAQDSLPLQTTFSATVAQDGATSLDIHIFEQASAVEDEAPSSNREVTPEGGARLSNLPSLPRGSVIDFELFIDSEGKSTMYVFEPVTGQRIELEIILAVMQAEELEQAREIVSGMTRRD